MIFEEQKKKQLMKKDLSNEGSWDVKIKSLCKKLNKKKNYYTTSSCAGRVVLLKGEIDKIRDAFLFKSHKKVSFGKIKDALGEIDYDGKVEFKQSSCILHVACKSVEDADELVKKAKLSGWKHSGIMGIGKRIMIELHSTENISFPIISNGKVLVDDNFLKIVIDEANEKLERVWNKIDKLKGLI
ncbi:hypothetical protein HOD75_02975 [archaeon]|jgi:tRNA wybutosine-synthesizing protein 3|nr:hypothetical protein [Candidatus Woesearchaeota archaeon]MBT4135610.1 hypothetical protein [archaeon]MBT4241837.1 hypothetical protein [archaeon]MBT4418385.1 hypothetical protein [archaeon]